MPFYSGQLRGANNSDPVKEAACRENSGQEPNLSCVFWAEYQITRTDITLMTLIRAILCKNYKAMYLD